MRSIVAGPSAAAAIDAAREAVAALVDAVHDGALARVGS